MGKKLGRDVLVYIAGEAIAHSKTCSISFSASEIDLSTKDSRFGDFLPDIITGSISGDGLTDHAAGIENVPTLFDILTNRTKVALKYSDEVEGNTRFTADAYLMSLSESDGAGEASSYSFEFKLVGEITKETIPAA